MNWLLASVLILHPVMEEPGDLRVVASGADAPVQWELDGRVVAETGDREAATLAVGAGTHELVARTDHEGPWEILARPDPRGSGTATYVPAWTAQHVPAPADDALWRLPIWVGPAGLALAALVFGTWPRKRKDRPSTVSAR